MDPIRLALSADFRDEQSEVQRGEITYSEHTVATHKGRIPCFMNPVISSMYLFMYSPASHRALGTGHRAVRQTVMMTLPLPNLLSVGEHASYKHPKCDDNTGSVGCWPRDAEGWGPSESDLPFPLLPHLTAPLDAAMDVTSRSVYIISFGTSLGCDS